MPDNARQIDLPEVPIKKEAAPPKPARPEPPKLRSQWPAKAQTSIEAPRPANRFESPPQPAPYILTPDRRHIDAYWRSRHQAMGSAHDEQATSLRRVSNPAFDARYQRNDYRDHDDYDDIYQDDEPEVVPVRRQKRNLSRHGRTGRDLAIAAGLALSLSTVAGAAVYDRASGGTIAAAIMAPFAGEGENQAVAEVPNVIVTPEAAAPAVVAEPAKVAEVSTAPEPLPAPQPAAPTEEVVATGDIKPIATAKLEVADATGIANTPVDLDLRAVPGQAGQDLELRVSGVPEDANLSAGTKISPTSWSLKPAEAAIVKLVMPAQRSGEFDLAVAAVETKTGELVAPMQEISVTVESATPTEAAAEPPAPAAEKKDTDQIAAEETVPTPSAPVPVAEKLPTETIERAAVPPPQVTAALNPQPDPTVEPVAVPVEALPAASETPKPEAPAADNDQTRTLINRGDHLMSLGDLAAAREFYMEALKLGAAPTALLQVGMTYDPVVYAAHKVAGLSPDRQMALQYYRQADQAGVAAARDAIAKLEAWQ